MEPNSSTHQDLSLRLSKLGYEVVDFASSGIEAIVNSKELQPDLVLMNTRLGTRGDGINTGKLIQSKNSTPIVYFSTEASKDSIQRMGATRPFGFIRHPFDDIQLFATIEIALTRHNLEKKLVENGQWLDGVLMSIGDGVIAVNNAGSIRFMNLVAEEVTGWESDQAMDKKLFEVFDIRNETSGELIDLSTGLTELRGDSALSDAIEAVLISKSSSKIPVSIKLRPIFDQRDILQGVVLSFRDVTAEREAFEQLKKQANRTEAIIQITRQLNSRFDLKAALKAFCINTNSVIKTFASMVFLVDGNSGIFKEYAHKFEDDIPVAQEYPVKISFSITELEKYLSGSLSTIAISRVGIRKNLPYRSILRLLKINHLAVAPIVHQEKILGALICGSTGSREFSKLDLDFLTGLAEHITTAILNSRLYEQVRLGRERQRLLSKSLVTIQETERRHIARELHDELGQALTGLQLTLEVIKNQLGEPQKSKLIELQGSVTTIISQVQEMSVNLRPGMLDDLGLIPALNWHLDRFTQQTGIRVNLSAEKFTGRFPEEVEITIYRIVQEALTNVARHSGVNEVFVGLSVDDHSLWVEVLDKGRGFDTSTVLSVPTPGLSSMEERAELAGGYLTIKSYIDQGTQIVAALPIGDRPLERRKGDYNRFSGRRSSHDPARIAGPVN